MIIIITSLKHVMERSIEHNFHLIYEEKRSIQEKFRMLSFQLLPIMEGLKYSH